jgi:hypothetical protein
VAEGREVGVGLGIGVSVGRGVEVGGAAVWLGDGAVGLAAGACGEQAASRSKPSRMVRFRILRRIESLTLLLVGFIFAPSDAS